MPTPPSPATTAPRHRPPSRLSAITHSLIERSTVGAACLSYVDMHSQAAILQPHDFYLPCAIYFSCARGAPQHSQGTVQPILSRRLRTFVFPQASSTAVFDRLAADAAQKGAGNGLRRTVSAKHGLSAGATRRGGQVRAATLVFSSAFLSDRICRLTLLSSLDSIYLYFVSVVHVHVHVACACACACACLSSGAREGRGGRVAEGAAAGRRALDTSLDSGLEL